MAEDIIKLSDLIIAGCTLAGPILADQAQKWVERWQDVRNRKLATFRTLMATRATNLSTSHVEALNAVPIDFYKVKPVMDAWLEYYAHLSLDPSGNPRVSQMDFR